MAITTRGGVLILSGVSLGSWLVSLGESTGLGCEASACPSSCMTEAPGTDLAIMILIEYDAS